MNIFTLATMEHENSQMEQRHDLTMAQAYSIGYTIAWTTNRMQHSAFFGA